MISDLAFKIEKEKSSEEEDDTVPRWVVENLVKKEVFKMNFHYNERKKYSIVYESRMPLFH